MVAIIGSVSLARFRANRLTVATWFNIGNDFDVLNSIKLCEIVGYGCLASIATPVCHRKTKCHWEKLAPLVWANRDWQMQ